MKAIYRTVLLSMLILLFACGIKGENYSDMQPPFKLEEYFDGKVKAWGIVQDTSGNIVNRFDVVIEGTRSGDKITLDELFTYYDDGRTETRVWEITKIDDLHYEGTAGDIVGTAKGRAYGNALQWTYQMDVPVDDTTYRLTFDDWIWAMNDGVIVNRSYLKKFGFTVAEVTIFMQRQ
ncbi:DUF3833 domain-containing protein [Pseudodesulfovibrio sp.]|nr:DUF3833 domain-containing protein [Pseudodesulfovibrio sp.]